MKDKEIKEKGYTVKPFGDAILLELPTDLHRQMHSLIHLTENQKLKIFAEYFMKRTCPLRVVEVGFRVVENYPMITKGVLVTIKAGMQFAPFLYKDLFYVIISAFNIECIIDDENPTNETPEKDEDFHQVDRNLTSNIIMSSK